MVEVPRSSNLRFVGDPGTERVLFMLSNDPNPLAPQKAAVPPATAADAPVPLADNQFVQPASEITPLESGEAEPPKVMIASIEDAKSQRGAKGLVAEDGMQSTYAVVSRANGWKPRKSGMKDLVVESEGGVNYGVVPAAAVSGGGILTLEVKLTHR
jgi:hypothetical protein